MKVLRIACIRVARSGLIVNQANAKRMHANSNNVLL